MTESEFGIRFDDPKLNIPCTLNIVNLSERWKFAFYIINEENNNTKPKNERFPIKFP